MPQKRRQRSKTKGKKLLTGTTFICATTSDRGFKLDPPGQHSKAINQTESQTQRSGGGRFPRGRANDGPDFTPLGILKLQKCGEAPSKKRWELWFGGCRQISGSLEAVLKCLQPAPIEAAPSSMENKNHTNEKAL